MEENLLMRKHLKQLEPINLWEEEKCKEDLKKCSGLGMILKKKKSSKKLKKRKKKKKKKKKLRQKNWLLPIKHGLINF